MVNFMGINGLCMVSGGFLLINFSVKYRPFLYLLTFVLAIKPLLFLYIVATRYLFQLAFSITHFINVSFAFPIGLLSADFNVYAPIFVSLPF
jgi:hypothetical protein